MMNQGKQATSKIPMSEMKMQFPETFQREFRDVLKSYLLLKDALVSSDAGKVSAFAKATSIALKAINTSSPGEMEQAHIKKSIEMLDAIATNDILENQRAHYVILNENIVPIAMNVDSIDATLYVQKCPMANNNSGALWLSREKTVRNPYYGDQMLTCGSVIDTIQ